ncbi:hypothetical protein BGZ57DRAFT_120495 [Hyaloscypha finlandica]|nr:hypothetical protein BGZ57DRAFT_120495 [Hyaloscypha finlandica]
MAKIRQSMSELPLPAAPTGNRFALVTPLNNNAPIIIVTILSLTFSFLIFAVRLLFVKWRRLALDDAVLALAHVVGVGQWSSVFVALNNGLGKNLALVTGTEQARMGVLAGRTLFLVSLFLSKLSVLLVIRSLFSWERRRKTLATHVTILVVTLWGFAAALTLSVRCSPDYVLGRGEAQCLNHLVRLRAIMVVDILTESAIFVLPLVFLNGLHMATRKKNLVIIAFSSRLPLIILSILYLRIQSNYIRISSSGTAIVPVVLFQEIYLGYSLMSATIPCLKSFVQGFTTGGVGYERDESWLFSTSSSSDRFKMRSIAKKLPLPALPSEPLPMPRAAKFPSLRLQDSMDTTEGGRSLRSQGSQQPMIWEAR